MNKLSKLSVWVVSLLLAVCFGCASRPGKTPLLEGSTLQGNPVCLENPEGIPDVVRKFFATRDLTTEEGKIDYLLERIRKSDLVFIRNDVEYDGKSSSQFLRWKFGRLKRRYKFKIETAKDFVEQVTSGSRTSGEPYTVILKDGSQHNLQSILQNELNVLEFCLRQYAPKAEEAKGNSSAETTADTTTAAQAPPEGSTLT